MILYECEGNICRMLGYHFLQARDSIDNIRVVICIVCTYICLLDFVYLKSMIIRNIFCYKSSLKK